MPIVKTTEKGQVVIILTLPVVVGRIKRSESASLVVAPLRLSHPTAEY